MPPCNILLKRGRALLVGAALAGLVNVHPAAADTVEIPAVRDNTLFKSAEGALSSGSGPHIFCGNNSVSNTRRAVIAFDVAGSVPAGATIDSVALVLNISSAPNETPQSISLHRLLADWGEGASVSSGGAGASSEPGDATWIHTFYPNEIWASAGGDFVGTASAAQTVAPAGTHIWAGPTMIADVQLWLDQPETAFGWLLQGNETEPSTVRRIDSREHTTTNHRPFLFVAYTRDPTAAERTSWGALKARYSTSPAATATAEDAAYREQP